MKRITFLLTGILVLSFVFAGCSDDDDPVIMGGINTEVMFMNYVVQNDDANMIMVYSWVAANWSNGPNGGIANAAADGKLMMASVTSVGGDTLALTDEAMMDELPSGSYYIGVFESSQMMYTASTASLIGYYDADATNNISMMPSDATMITVTTTTPIDLKTIMLMGGM